MEIKTYLRFVLNKWKIILFIFAVTLMATTVFTLRAVKIYQATVTYIVRLSTIAVDQKTTISALDTLSNRNEIAATYARVADSNMVENQAAEELGLSSADLKNISVNSTIVAGTNIMTITVQGSDPKIVRDYANAIGEQTVLYVQNLYEIYALEILDEAQLPKNPIKPKVANNLALGGVFGLVLGVGFALLLEYLRAPLDTKAGFNILDEKTGTYNKRFFTLRLHQEMNRTKRTNGVLSVALVDIDHRRLLDGGSSQARLIAVRSVISMFGKSLRDEDIMTPFSDTVLIVLLPDLNGKEAKQVIERLLESVSMISVELGVNGQATNLHGAAGVAPYYTGDSIGADELIARAQNALDSMRESTYGRVMISAEGAISGTQKAKNTSDNKA